MILSDVIGDPLDTIASGPTVPCPAPEREALRVLSRYHHLNVPASVVQHLEKKAAASEGEGTSDSRLPVIASSDGGTSYAHVENVLIGSNRIAAAAARAAATELGYTALVWSLRVSGEARLLGRAYAKIAHAMIASSSGSEEEETPAVASGKGPADSRWHPRLLEEEEEPFRSLLRQAPELSGDFAALLTEGRRLRLAPPVCIIGAGEPTVTVRGGGAGGRSQELALAFGIHAHELAQSGPSPGRTVARGAEAVFAAVGTDGQDGPCSAAAGAVVDRAMVRLAGEQGLSATGALEDNDSHTFFSKLCGGRCLVRTGLTGTNVMDLHLLLLAHVH